MSAKQRKNFMLPEQTIAYIDKIKAQQKISASAALNQIIEEHRDQELRQELSNYLVDKVAEEVQDKLHEELNKIRKRANATNRQTEVLLETMNTLMLHHGITEHTSTEEKTSPVLNRAAKIVIKRIAKKKQRKDSRTYKS